MKIRQFRIAEAILTITVVALFVWSAIIGNIAITMMATIMGASVIYLLRKRTKEVTIDERIFTIGEKASRRTVQIYAFSAAVVATILISLSQSGHPEFSQIGITLAFSAAALSMLYAGLYRYYAKKFGD